MILQAILSFKFFTNWKKTLLQLNDFFIILKEKKSKKAPFTQNPIVTKNTTASDTT